MPSEEEVIELSVEETNRLRADLGLAPLRLGSTTATTTESSDQQSRSQQKLLLSSSSSSTQQQSQQQNRGEEEAVLEMSVEETNALRERLGLPPLRDSSSKKKKDVVHAPAKNESEVREAASRIECSELEKQVREGMECLVGDRSETLGKSTGGTARSWAARMRRADTTVGPGTAAAEDSAEKRKYGESDLDGLNVAHSLSELQDGSTTVLTLADAPILKTRGVGDDDNDGATANNYSGKIVGLNDEDEVLLENTRLSERRKQRDGLREKRKAELGAGRAGGYSGLDDDEFEELGGTQGPSRLARGQFPGEVSGGDSDNQKKKPLSRGFNIGDVLEEQEEREESDLFAAQRGRAISLQPSRADVTASDFMTAEEEEEERQRKKGKKKDSKFKKQKKKDKKEKRRRRKANFKDDEEDEEERGATIIRNKVKKGFLEELEETAMENATTSRKRRRSEEEDGERGTDEDPSPKMDAVKVPSSETIREKEGDMLADKRAKYDAIMAKGNKRTREVFAPKSHRPNAQATEDDGADDAFLNAALSKARRLNRLREMSRAAEREPTKSTADAVVEAVQSAQRAAAAAVTTTDDDRGTVTFAVDETREFTRALRARAEQAERDRARKVATAAVAKKEDASSSSEKVVASSSAAAERSKVEPAEQKDSKEGEDDGDADMDIAELAKEVKEDDDDSPAVIAGLDGATGTTVPVGRGLGGVLDMLKRTGDITRKNAGKEVMRGRARDKRTYEDYEPLDLSKVVQIDRDRATDRDRQFAEREVKLEYRDGHGRLLTRHQAFRELSYKFHGYGSGKRKEEKKLQMIALERAEARLASRQAAASGAGAGTLGALKATQKATGKAFVVHKT